MENKEYTITYIDKEGDTVLLKTPNEFYRILLEVNPKLIITVNKLTKTNECTSSSSGLVQENLQSMSSGSAPNQKNSSAANNSIANNYNTFLENLGKEFNHFHEAANQQSHVHLRQASDFALTALDQALRTATNTVHQTLSPLLNNNNHHSSPFMNPTNSQPSNNNNNSSSSSSLRENKNDGFNCSSCNVALSR